MLITFEGLDLSGKSTQAKMLMDRFEQAGVEIVFIREPGGTELGEKIRTILLDKENSGMTDVAELLLFSASRAQLVREKITPDLDAGRVVVCDRFYDSTTAYQGWGRGISVQAIETINWCAAAGLSPDVTFFLDLPVDEIERRAALASKEKDRMESNSRQFYERVRQGYLDLAQRNPRIVILDATRSEEDLHSEIWSSVMVIRTRKGKSAGKGEA